MAVDTCDVDESVIAWLATGCGLNQSLHEQRQLVHQTNPSSDQHRTIYRLRMLMSGCINHLHTGETLSRFNAFNGKAILPCHHRPNPHGKQKC